MKILPIPLLEDNYSYLIYGKNTNEAMVVDPSEAFPLINLLEKMPEIQVTNILLTHKHWDHTGGVADLLRFLENQLQLKGLNKKIDVYAGAEENFSLANVWIKNEETRKFDDLKITMFPAPCHTRGHLLFLIEDLMAKDPNEE